MESSLEIESLKTRVNKLEKQIDDIWVKIAREKYFSAIDFVRNPNERAHFSFLSDIINLILEKKIDLNRVEDVLDFSLLWECSERYQEIPPNRYLFLLKKLYIYCDESKNEKYCKEINSIFEELYNQFGEDEILEAIHKWENR
jgi:hypothetical protein